MCKKCNEKRKPNEKSAIEIMQEVQLSDDLEEILEEDHISLKEAIEYIRKDLEKHFKNSKPLDEDLNRILHDNIWDLYEI